MQAAMLLSLRVARPSTDLKVVTKQLYKAPGIRLVTVNLSTVLSSIVLFSVFCVVTPVKSSLRKHFTSSELKLPIFGAGTDQARSIAVSFRLVATRS